MSHNGHCVIRTMHKKWLRLISLKWRWMMPPCTKKRITGTAFDFYARRSRNCVVEHAQLGYLQKVAYFLLWVCWETPQNQSKAHALSAMFILPTIFLKLQQILAVMHHYLHNQPVMPCLLTKLPSTQVWVKNVSVCLYPRPTWDHCEIFLTDCVSSLVCGN